VKAAPGLAPGRRETKSGRKLPSDNPATGKNSRQDPKNEGREAKKSRVLEQEARKAGREKEQ